MVEGLGVGKSILTDIIADGYRFSYIVRKRIYLLHYLAKFVFIGVGAWLYGYSGTIITFKNL